MLFIPLFTPRPARHCLWSQNLTLPNVLIVVLGRANHHRQRSTKPTRALFWRRLPTRLRPVVYSEQLKVGMMPSDPSRKPPSLAGVVSKVIEVWSLILLRFRGGLLVSCCSRTCQEAFGGRAMPAFSVGRARGSRYIARRVLQGWSISCIGYKVGTSTCNWALTIFIFVRPCPDEKMADVMPIALNGLEMRIVLR